MCEEFYMSKKDKPCCPERLGTVGGQAVLEGVKMCIRDRGLRRRK